MITAGRTHDFRAKQMLQFIPDCSILFCPYMWRLHTGALLFRESLLEIPVYLGPLV